ncbi:AAA family ATPase [Pseudonocardia sp. EV170527-09]|uniref:AAA family ATPase n=1 Tax=Pseudonocardia sp. EV170527-09 TaxID=2603411 RepID=UPI0013872C94|nr:AAA family ATPase [Pseudonocardia sp. EV170527-09]
MTPTPRLRALPGPDQPPTDPTPDQHESSKGSSTVEQVGRRLRLTSAASITLRPTHWLWTDRIPAGSIVLGPGREGIGKSLFCAWLTAQVTNGTLDGLHTGRARAVVYAATEDSWERTIAGRLLAAGADMNRVFRVDVTHPGADGARTVPLSLPRDCTDLAVEMGTHDVALLVLDPLISAVDSRINVNQEELRGALEPLATLADNTGAAIFGLAHFNKASGTDVLSRVTGSRAFAAVARAGIAFARDPDADDGSCVISQVKNNLGPLDLPSLRYRVEPVTLDTPEGPAQWGRLVMLGETDRHVEAIMRQAEQHSGDGEDATDLADIDAWLASYLIDRYGRAPAADVLKQGGALGFSKAQLYRSKKRLKISSGKGDGWAWTLPDIPPP